MYRYFKHIKQPVTWPEAVVLISFVISIMVYGLLSNG